MTTNIGAYADNGETVNVQGDVFGVFHGERPRRDAGRAAEKHAVDVGIIAVLDDEMRAVVGSFSATGSTGPVPCLMGHGRTRPG